MKQDYSWNTSADKYIKMYRELTGIYDEPAKAAPKKSTFAANIKKDAEKSAKAAALAADKPKITEVKNPFEPEKPVKKNAAKKPTAKKTTKKTPSKKAKGEN